MRHVLAICLLWFSCFYMAWPVTAASRDMPLPDAMQEKRAQSVFMQLRCMVCAGESIHDSNADLARDLRMLVREHIASGQTDEQILSYISERYGKVILMDPPISPSTYVLWFGPALLGLCGAYIVFLAVYRRA